MRAFLLAISVLCPLAARASILTESFSVTVEGVHTGMGQSTGPYVLPPYVDTTGGDHPLISAQISFSGWFTPTTVVSATDGTTWLATPTAELFDGNSALQPVQFQPQTVTVENGALDGSKIWLDLTGALPNWAASDPEIRLMAYTSVTGRYGVAPYALDESTLEGMLSVLYTYDPPEAPIPEPPSIFMVVAALGVSGALGVAWRQ